MNKNDDEKAVVRGFSLPRKLERRLVAFAQRERRPLSWVAKDALAAYLEQQCPIMAEADGGQEVQYDPVK